MRATLPARARRASAGTMTIERRYYDDYERRLAAEIVSILSDRDEARRGLEIADRIMNLTLTPR
jgi:hypothetical protein